MFWVYKCRSHRQPYQRAWGDWADFFKEGRTRKWGSTAWTPEIRRVRLGDTIIAYQTDRNELVGIATVVGLKQRGQYQDLMLKPLRRVGVKVRPLKRSDPRIAAIPAFKPGPIRTLYEISDKDADRLLRAAGVGTAKGWSADVTSAGVSRGAGFGSWDENRRVERAAMGVVRRYFEARDWLVDDISTEDRGYDLLCKRAGKELHVEVKGVKGERAEFLITANEERAWRQDRMFVLALVTEALRDPKLRFFRGPKSRVEFELIPVSYMARLKGEGVSVRRRRR